MFLKNRKTILPILLTLLIAACQSPPSLTDRDGNSYQTRYYGQQLWMIENLRVIQDSSAKEVKYYFPNQDSSLADDYGLLYDYPTACKVCPQGWHIPSNQEWRMMLLAIGKNDASLLKDPAFWPANNFSNASDFSARPSGYGNEGEFDNFFGSRTIFWSASKDQEHDVWAFILQHDLDSMRHAPQHPTYAFSVRCVRDTL